ncbi:MAG: transcription-repair coupling factor [Chloroflexi bacterium]|nr:transcription-repair coupling factor [Chloroflexota bacterium]
MQPGERALLRALLPAELIGAVFEQQPGRALEITGIPESYEAALIAAATELVAAPALLLVMPTAAEAHRLHEELRVWLGKSRTVLLFPDLEAQPYERLISDPHITGQRLAVLLALGKNEQPAIVTSATALVGPVLDLNAVRSHTRLWKSQDRFPLNETIRTWLQLGYEPASLVEEAGTFSRRGGVIDIFPVTASQPYRIELFDDVIESIHTFDPSTQRTTGQVNQLWIPPAREVFPPLSKVALEELQSLPVASLREDVRVRWENDLEELTAGNSIDGIEFFSAYFDHRTQLLDTLPAGALVVIVNSTDCENAIHRLLEEGQEAQQRAIEIGDIPAGVRQAYSSWGEALQPLLRFPLLLMETNFQDIDGISLPGLADLREALPALRIRRITTDFAVSAPQHFANRFRLLVEHLREALATGWYVAISSPQAERIRELCEGFDLPVRMAEDLLSPWAESYVTIVQGAHSAGWMKRDTHHELLTDLELFGQQAQRSLVRRPQVDRAFLAELQPGDYVVHIEHGIGRYRGIITRDFGAGQRDYIQIEYQGDDHLYVPTDQLHNVSRYVGAGEETPRLNRLGTAEWARTKEHARKAVRDIAADLLRLYALRASQKGYAFSPDTEWQEEMEAAFPHVETPDQLRTIEEVKADMERPRIMDRLVCGDVGYGKTEVALRAAFKAAISGKQVAVLTSTTVLAEQHFLTFSRRFENFPVRVELLSRFRSRSEQQHVIADLASGKVEVVVGTHRLLQRDVQFKDLGLLIIDEEQRFGVEHKEHLKQLRQEVDVLTLTATPIPRTLNMSLSGLRDLSVIDTPPEERMPVKTIIAQEDDRLIRSAIVRECERNGQVFYLHNRVQTIDVVAARLRELVPEVSIGVAHGQMAPDRLERAMRQFAEGHLDLLLCTTIIENGLDIPNANTLIIDRATNLGLAQLYQLRGRVGRSNRRAYAYLLYPKGTEPTEVARRRLRAIFEASELGAGFKIAMRDLEIRGAGDLLGANQSGHVGAVGFHLYTQMLAEEIDRLKGVPEQTPLQTLVDFPVSARLPDRYIGDAAVKVDLYRRLAAATRLEEVEQLREELHERFGPLPGQAENLLTIVEVKVRAAALGIPSVIVRDDELVVKLPTSGVLSRSALYRTYGAAIHISATQLRLPLRALGERWLTELPALLAQLAGQSTKR